MDIQAKDGKVYHLTYNDVRRFGFMLLVDTRSLYEHPLLKKLGLEPMSNAFSGSYLQEVFVNKKYLSKEFCLISLLLLVLGIFMFAKRFGVVVYLHSVVHLR